jgi:hypothetical protein
MSWPKSALSSVTVGAIGLLMIFLEATFEEAQLELVAGYGTRARFDIRGSLSRS